MDPGNFPGFEISGDFLIITAPGIRLKIVTWIAKAFNKPDSQFVWLGSAVCIPTLAFPKSHFAFQSDRFIKSDELEARYGSEAEIDTLDEDLKHDKAQCKSWTRSGIEDPLLRERVHKVFSQITNISIMRDSKVYIDRWKAGKADLPESVYDNYREIWKSIAQSAADFSGRFIAAHPTDFKFRFYQGPITPPVDIIFSPLVDWINETKLQQLFDDVLKEAKGLTWPASFKASTMSKDDAEKSSTLVTFSTNPFGYFRTLISFNDLTRLVDAQTEPAVAGQPRMHWHHAFPPPNKVKEADDRMKQLPKPPVRKQYTVTRMDIKKSTGGAQAQATRKKTQDIMGGVSANKVCSSSTLELSSDVFAVGAGRS